jgi:outer membrane protein assembly factor BamB
MDLDLGVVYVCDNSGKVTSLYLENGTTKWQWRSGSEQAIQSSPLVVPGGNIYFGSDDAYLYSLYPNGTLAWRFEGCLGWIYTSPSIFLNLIYFGSCDGKMRAVSATDGTEQWNFTTRYIPSSPAVVDGRVYFGAYDKNIYSLDALNGEIVWNTTLGDDIYSSPSVSGDRVVVGSNDGLLYLLDRENGYIMWTLDLGPSPLETSPVISKDKIAVTYDQGLVIVGLHDGTIHARYLFGDARDVSPSISQDKVFFGDQQGFVHCLEKMDIVIPDDDDDDDDVHLDLNRELSVRRDVVYFLIAFVIIAGVVFFIYFRKYKPLRGA